jgi:membrane-associated phospholipid phosphatase
LIHLVVRRAAIAAVLVSAFFAAYEAIVEVINLERARELTTRFDGLIAFDARWIWVYVWAYPAALIPFFFVRSERLMHRVALAYAVVFVVSFSLFAALPVTSFYLRMPRIKLDTLRASDWLVALVYAWDLPYNCFPSLHVSVSVLAACVAWRVNRKMGAAAFGCAMLVAVSVCKVKQHFVADALAGAVLGAVAGALLLRRYKPNPGESPGFGWGAVVTYVVFVALIYGGLFGLYRFCSPDGKIEIATHSPPIAAAKALAFNSSPVACRVSPFQSSERPGSNTLAFKKSPIALLPTKLASTGFTPWSTSRAIALKT